ncbi:t-SNARE domain-containing 1 isoform X1 [Paramuricea clavata]|uniref:t-SNARE domain-containing 1 isoform X1 n=1 Tax=Paramuricea clavata TaxID=317549 RepID=A0A7D9E8V1_PARCT|nr:t-SNARE domain-containing 1 isoform X1 [Paramuricea clavata]
MSEEFSGGYGSIRGQSGGNQDDRGASGGYQSEDYVIFQSLSDTISSNIFQINSNVQALERICKQLGNQLTEVPYDKLHRIQQGTNKLASDTTVCLKRMINLQGSSVSEKRKQRLQQERLKDEFENSISKYRNIQKKLSEKSKQMMNSTGTVKFTSHRGDQIPGFDDGDDKTRLLSDEQQSQQQLEDSVSLDQSLLEERERMTRQLESDILDVNEIFRDLASIVHDQGEVVDSIEGHVIRAHDDVENANEQLQKASVYRRKARKKKCCLLLILLIILAIIAIIIYIKTKN